MIFRTLQARPSQKEQEADKGCFIPNVGAGFHGLNVEFQTLMGSVSPAQREAISQLQSQGYRVEMIRTEA